MKKIDNKLSINDLLKVFSEDKNLVEFATNYNKVSKRSLKLNFKEDIKDYFLIIEDIYSSEDLLKSLETNYYYRNNNSILGNIESNDHYFLTTKEKFIGIELVESILRYSCLKKYLSKISLSKDNFEILIENTDALLSNTQSNTFLPKFFYFDDNGRFVLDGIDDHVYVCKDLSLEIEFVPREENQEFFLSKENLYSFNTKYYK